MNTATDDFFRSRLDQMIELRHPLAVLASRLGGKTGQCLHALALADVLTAANLVPLN
jgi:hypothetical protein